MVFLFINMRSLVSCRKICAPNHFQFQLSVGVLNGLLDPDNTQPVIHNTINSWDYMNLLWTKRIIKRTKMSPMQWICHRRYHVNILIYVYLSFNLQIHARDRQKKYHQQIFFSMFKIKNLKYLKYLQSERKYELSISKKMWQHVYRSGSRIKCFHLFIFISYVPGLYFVSSLMW